MNLRHIDPGSTDWMDAMLEGELDGQPQKHGRRDGDQGVESEPGILAASAAPTNEPLATRPPPGR